MNPRLLTLTFTHSKIMAETLVKPSTIDISDKVVHLPAPDQFMLRIYAPILLCFRLSANADPQKVYSELCCGLSDALVEFPFFAGRIVKIDAASDRIQINLSTDYGVPFKYRDLTSEETQPPFPDFDELERAYFPPSRVDTSLTL